MNIEQISKNKPNGATHYYVIMFLGLVYIHYRGDQPFWFDESQMAWVECSRIFSATPL